MKMSKIEIPLSDNHPVTILVDKWVRPWPGVRSDPGEILYVIKKKDKAKKKKVLTFQPQ